MLFRTLINQVQRAILTCLLIARSPLMMARERERERERATYPTSYSLQSVYCLLSVEVFRLWRRVQATPQTTAQRKTWRGRIIAECGQNERLFTSSHKCLVTGKKRKDVTPTKRQIARVCAPARLFLNTALLYLPIITQFRIGKEN